jgi:hypothetical protein
VNRRRRNAAARRSGGVAAALRGLARLAALAVLAAVALRPAAAVAAAPSPGSPAELVGVWRGTSLCTDLATAPACKDEQVIYTFVAIADGAPGAVRLAADKVVAGERQAMGELDFVYRAASGCWESEQQNARFHSRWSFAVRGTALSGELVDLPSGARIRAIRVEKDAVP